MPIAGLYSTSCDLSVTWSRTRLLRPSRGSVSKSYTGYDSHTSKSSHPNFGPRLLQLSTRVQVAPLVSLPTQVFGNIFHFHSLLHPQVRCTVTSVFQFWREVAINHPRLWTTVSIQIKPQNIHLYLKELTVSCPNQAAPPARAME